MDTASTASSTSSFKNIPSTDLCNDPRFVSKLHKKIKTTFCERHVGNGIPTLNDVFLRLDRAIGSDNYDCDVWKFKQFFSGSGLTEKDLDVLFLLVDSDADGKVDLAETMLYARKLFLCNSHQFHEILKRMRARKLKVEDSCFLTPANKQQDQPTRAAVFDYLISKACACTESEAFFVLDYCSNPSEDDGGADDGYGAAGGGDGNAGDHHQDDDLACGGRSHGTELDVDYLSAALFTAPSLPSDIAYPILLGKLADAAADPSKGFNGSIGILKCCGVSTRIVYADGASPPDESGGSNAPTPTKLDRSGGGISGAISLGVGGSGATPTKQQHRPTKDAPDDVSLDLVGFRKFVQGFGGGLPTIEVDQLFNFIASPATSTVSVRYVSQLIEGKIPLLPQEELMLVVNLVRSQIVSSTGLNALHQRLCAWGTEQKIPLASFAGVLRECGVGAHAVADVQLEHLWREASTCVDVVLLLRGTVGVAREALLRQLFDKLDDDKDGLIEKLVMSEAFHSEGIDVGRDTRRVYKKEIEAYLLSLPGTIDDSMTYAEFSYFWGNVSAGVFDDAAFQMLLWKSYNMHRKEVPVVAGGGGVGRSASNASGSSVQRRQYAPGGSFAVSNSAQSSGNVSGTIVPPLLGLSEATSPARSNQRRFLRD